METIDLIYKWFPDRVHHSQQQLFYVDEKVIVTVQRVKPSSPIIQKGEMVLGDNFPVFWFVFTGLWYSIAKVYDLGNKWTGYYCDIMEPVKRGVDTAGKLDYFEITDLFLDLWINPDGTYEIQDEDEFEEAVQNGAIDAELERKAREVLDTLIAKVEDGHLDSLLKEVFDRAQLPDLRGYVETLSS